MDPTKYLKSADKQHKGLIEVRHSGSRIVERKRIIVLVLRILPQRSEEVATNQKNRIRCLLRTFPLRSFQSKVGLKKKKNASSSDLTSFLKGERVLFGETRGRTSKKTEEIYGLIGPMSLLNYACEAPLVIDEYGWSVRFRRNGQIDEEEEITVDCGGDGDLLWNIKQNRLMIGSFCVNAEQKYCKIIYSQITRPEYNSCLSMEGTKAAFTCDEYVHSVCLYCNWEGDDFRYDEH
ncbi:hypothetical protein PROFUN_15638 [Planoprotostelium fungivorum]|uniref:Uncharacterized protein n=1 Tax=Planoprotostelium fungivorum TaxID=1890364 RepID=A0A2P6MTM4_9EUKA|nr:hypothetical protein PROFUN_15638 [Planoprotostelium fungivorum]